MFYRFFVTLALIVLPTVGTPQAVDPIVVATVTRAPFSLVEGGKETGFSLDLWVKWLRALAVKRKSSDLSSLRICWTQLRQGVRI
ncbi:hypothetical protein NIG5292_01301 [Nereida ignava]|uniref:Uncharacterized protein n=1 Tax=Nereida ignava TaxID=282199 RepID=A0A0U1NKP5_9RHOB|nr:hypothetical protein NIG5292_01301 [Nereida ignava]SFI96666.1 hypothetical protein SAMN02745667_00011 [Nereida ignava DSM 16309]